MKMNDGLRRIERTQDVSHGPSCLDVPNSLQARTETISVMGYIILLSAHHAHVRVLQLRHDWTYRTEQRHTMTSRSQPDCAGQCHVTCATFYVPKIIYDYNIHRISLSASSPSRFPRSTLSRCLVCSSRDNPISASRGSGGIAPLTCF